MFNFKRLGSTAKLLLTAGILLFLLLGLFLFVSQQGELTALAAASGPFGGTIHTPLPCNGGAKWLIRIQGFNGGQYIYVPPTKYREAPPIRDGQLIIGIAGSAAFCTIGKTVHSYPRITNNSALLFGTSF